ncbi:HPF/RaiA family ribosome-associated protein [Candidatus Endoriftia persephone]|nr:HPF/RaiA family ribosome-associated protein [Candidatus Endoriftia persephone]USF89091.1 HPF/RaiA family ribosome-associated protein [Candidatus Endoriftia persephone]
MKIPLQVTFRDIPHSDALEADIREKAAKLEEYYDQIMSCRIMIESPHGHHHKGNLYHVRVDITVPGDEIVVSRSPDQHHAHEDAYVTVRDAFNAARRQLQDFARKQRQKVKLHEVPPHGAISKLVADEGYGMIQADDGREIYFHRNSIVNGDYDVLEIGNEVRFTEEAGDEGPQASRVHVIGKHHIVT